MLAGVAGGLAEMWDADPSLVRVIWALLVVFTGGVALVVYIVMALVVPEDDLVYPGRTSTASTAEAPPVTGSGWVAPGTDPRVARSDARAARRAARGDGGSFPAALLLGGFLVLLGGLFLAREFIPQLDFDMVWPLFLIGLGAALLMTALRRRPDGPGSTDVPKGPANTG